jgi:hypothetical protein
MTINTLYFYYGKYISLDEVKEYLKRDPETFAKFVDIEDDEDAFFVFCCDNFRAYEEENIRIHCFIDNVKHLMLINRVMYI